MATTTTILPDDHSPSEAGMVYGTGSPYQTGRSPSSLDHHYASSLSGTSPLSATAFHTLSMNPPDMHAASAMDTFVGDYYAPHGAALPYIPEGMEYAHGANYYAMRGPNLPLNGGYSAPFASQPVSAFDLPSQGSLPTNRSHHAYSGYGAEVPPLNTGAGEQKAQYGAPKRPMASSSHLSPLNAAHLTNLGASPASGKICATNSPPQSPKLRHRRRTTSTHVPTGSATTSVSSAPSSMTSSGPLTASTVTPAYSLPSSPQAALAPPPTLDESHASYSYDGNHLSSGSSPYTSHTNSPHSIGYIGPQPLQGDWDDPTHHAYAPSLPSLPTSFTHHNLRVPPLQHHYPSVPYPQNQLQTRQQNSNFDPNLNDADYSFTNRKQVYLQQSISPNMGRENPLTQSTPNNGYFMSSGASSLPATLPSNYTPNYPYYDTSQGGSQSNAHIQNYRSNRGREALHESDESHFYSMTSAELMQQATPSDMIGMQQDPSNNYMDTTSPPPMMPEMIDSRPMRQFTSLSSPNLHPPVPTHFNLNSNVVSQGSGSRGGNTQAMLGPTASSRLSQNGPSGMSSSIGGFSSSHVNSMGGSGAGAAQDKNGVMRGFSTSSPSSSSGSRNSPHSLRVSSSMAKQSSKNSPMSPADQGDYAVEPVQFLDAFVTIFEPRAPINVDVSWSVQDAKSVWYMLMSENDEVTPFLVETGARLEKDFVGAVKQFVRLFEYTVVLIGGASSLCNFAVEMHLLPSCHMMLHFLNQHPLVFDSVESTSDRECDRLLDALAMYAVYQKDRQNMQDAYMALRLAYNVLSENVPRLSLECIDRLYIWTLFIVSVPEERTKWFSIMARAGVAEPGHTPMAIALTQQSSLLSQFASGPRLDEEGVSKMWALLDEFEQQILSLEKSQRTRAFRYLRLATASILRAELLTRYGNSADAQAYSKHVIDIAMASPGFKLSITNTLKSLTDQVLPNGEVAGLVCAAQLIAQIDHMTTNSGGNATSAAANVGSASPNSASSSSPVATTTTPNSANSNTNTITNNNNNNNNNGNSNGSNS